MSTKESNKVPYFLISYFLLLFFALIIADFSLWFPSPLLLSATMFLMILYLLIKTVSGSQIIDRKNIKYAVAFIMIYIIFHMYGLLMGYSYSGRTWLTFLLSGSFLMLRDDYKRIIIVITLKVYALYILVSLIEYILFMLTTNGIVLGEVIREHDGSTYIHLLTNLIKNTIAFPRFQSLYEEPGNVGTLHGLLLFGMSRFRSLTREFYIILISGIFSFSLAYYLILAVFALTKIRNIRFWNVLVAAILLIGCYVYFSDFFDNLIVERLQDRQNIDNRTDPRFDRLFFSEFTNGGLILGHGIGSVAGPGLKVFVYQNGIIGLFSLAITMLFIYCGKCRKLKGLDFLFLLAFALSFYQRHWIDRLDMIYSFILPALALKEGCHHLRQ